MLKKNVVAISIAVGLWWLNQTHPKLQLVLDFGNFFTVKLFFYYFAYQYCFRGCWAIRTIILGSIKMALCFACFYMLEDGHFSKIAQFKPQMLFDSTNKQLSPEFLKFAQQESLVIILAFAGWRLLSCSHVITLLAILQYDQFARQTSTEIGQLAHLNSKTLKAKLDNSWTIVYNSYSDPIFIPMFLTGLVFFESEYEFCLSNFIFQALGPLLAYHFTSHLDSQKMLKLMGLDFGKSSGSNTQAIQSFAYLIILVVLVFYVIHLDRILEFITIRGGTIFSPVFSTQEKTSPVNQQTNTQTLEKETTQVKKKSSKVKNDKTN